MLHGLVRIPLPGVGAFEGTSTANLCAVVREI